MRLIFLLLLCFSFNRLNAQDSLKTYYFKSVDWKIAMSSDFKINDPAREVEIQNRGIQLIEKANDIEVGDLSDLKTLISAFKGRFEYFNSTIRKFDLNTEGNYDSLGTVVNKVIYNSLSKQMPDAKLDTSSSWITIDKIVFNKYQLSVTIREKKLFTMVMLSKLYMGFDFGITYLYISDETKGQIENMLEQSTFKK